MGSTQTGFSEMATLIARLMVRWAAFANLPRKLGTGRRIYPAEIYAIEAIGRVPGVNVTRLAASLGVTKGAASQTVGKLVRKGLASKVGGAHSAKEVCLVLTERGRVAFRAEEKFYQIAYRLFLARYQRRASNRVRQFRETFSEFSAFFEEFVRRCPVDLPAEGRQKATRQP